MAGRNDLGFNIDGSSQKLRNETPQNIDTGVPKENVAHVAELASLINEESDIKKMDRESDTVLKQKESFILEERARALAAQSKFYEASSFLEEIDFMEGTSELGMKLLMAECYMQLGRENKAMRAVKDIRKIILSPPMCEVDDVMSLADELIENKSIVRALILLRIASDMFQEVASGPNEIIDGIFRCIAKMQNPVRGMIKPEESSNLSGLQALMRDLLAGNLKSLGGADALKGLDPSKALNQSDGGGRQRIIAMDFGVEYMLEMLEDLRKVQNADPEKKTLKIAWATNFIGYNYSLLNESAKILRILKIGIDALEKQFGKDASKHKVYSTLLNNIGAALHNAEKFSEAEIVKVKAVEAKENALDFDDENERNRDLEEVRASLKITRKHLMG